MTVEIDDAIRRDPELLRDVEAATEYLRTMPTRVEPPHVARWRRADMAGAMPMLELDDKGGVDPVRAVFQRRVLSDRYGRESAIRQTWRELLKQRSETAHKRVEAMLAELDAEEANGQ